MQCVIQRLMTKKFVRAISWALAIRILAVGQGIEDITVETLKEMVDEDTEIISIYYGADVTEEDAEQLCERLEELYPDFDVEINQADSRFITTWFP